MSNNSVQVTLDLNKRVSFIQRADEIKQTSLEQILEALTVEECREIIAKSVRTVDIEPITLYMLVKKVIDAFDLYTLFPGIDTPCSEYDLESRSIAEKIQYGMSVTAIAAVIKDVFDYYFDTQDDVGVYMEPAKQIHNNMNRYL